MKPIHILLFVLAIGILYYIVRRYKPNTSYHLEKSKELVQDIVDRIPKKMQKIIVKSKDIFPAGAIKLASVVSNIKPGKASKEDKMLETFEDIKDIRYGKIGGANIKDGISENKWIKVSSLTISGAWEAKGFTLEIYPRLRNHSSSRQTLVALVRNLDKDVEAPYLSLNTHNEFTPNTRFIKDVRMVRVSGSGITDNKLETWVQIAHNWADKTYVMYYLYNFQTKDFVATVPQEMLDKIPSGQAWGLTERIEPQDGKSTVNAGKGNGWGTALNINAPQQPESLYSLHFGDGSDIHGRQAGMGYIKDQPNRIWGNTRGTLGMHIHQDDDLHLYSSGWNPLFSVKGGSGNVYAKGNIQTNGQINTMGKTNYPKGWGGGVRTWDIYSSATIGVGDEEGNLKGYFNSAGDAWFSRNTTVGGNLNVQGGANVEGKLRLRHIGANGDDNSDPYYMEKLNTSGDVNSLRLTINDNADESFQIWGNSCNVAGGCGGPGALQHSFIANGDASHKGTLTAFGGANLEGTVRFRHRGANGDDNSDPYYLEKVQSSSNNNSLRLTINDDADESFQIWGNSCGTGDCGGPGAMQHSFVANGDVTHKGTVSAGKVLEARNKARYIRVGNTDATLRKDYWTLIELRAYDHNGTNVALNKPVRILHGRKWADQTPPERIVDGQIFDSPNTHHDNWYKGYHGDTGLNVLEIDLGSEVDLAQIELFNRWNGDIDWRMDGTTIEFIATDGKRNRIIYTGLWHRQYSKEYLL